jgi:hypothetical protein
MGIKRGLRAMGLLALIEGERRRKPRGESAGRAVHDIGNAFLLHPVMGPTPEFVLTAGFGKDTRLLPIREGDVHVPGLGGVHVGGPTAMGRFSAAVMNANPLIESYLDAQHPGHPRPLRERAPELLGAFNPVKKAPRRR